MDVYRTIKGSLKFMDRFWKVQAQGLENILDGRGILAPTHADWKDTFAMEAKIGRKMYWVGNKDLVNEDMEKRADLYWEFLKYGYEGTKEKRAPGLYNIIAKAMAYIAGIIPKTRAYIPVNLHGNGNNAGSLKKVIDLLDDDQLVAWFPAGHLMPDEEMAPFKEGVAFTISLYHNGNPGKKKDIPVYPVALKDTSKLFKRGANTYISIGKPLYLLDHMKYKESRKEAITSFIQVLESEVRTLHSKLGK